jgi:hypothetical protein
MEGFDLSTDTRSESAARELEILLEAARRATWDALHGPTHLRSGRYYPGDAPVEVGAGTRTPSRPD